MHRVRGGADSLVPMSAVGSNRDIRNRAARCWRENADELRIFMHMWEWSWAQRVGCYPVHKC